MAILVMGLSFFGIGEAFLVQSMLGNSPWTVLAQGVSIKTSLPLGLVTGMISVVVLLIDAVLFSAFLCKFYDFARHYHS